MKRYPVGIQDFQKIRDDNYTYVDKTQFIYEISNIGGYYFLSRPRRFGKSLLVSTLDYLFQGKKDLFEGLFIYDKWNWEQKNPLIKISFAAISHKELGLFNAINRRLDEIAKQYDLKVENSSISAKFLELIKQLSEKYGKVVVLIDEYDKPIIDYLGTDTPKAIENREVFKSFYSILKDADPYLKLVFITGVSKFSRVSIFSDLNNLQDITISPRFANCCGITEQEVENNFSEELQKYPKAKIKQWYNGYTWDLKTSVYNPFSLLNFFTEGQFKNYWFESGTPTFLINLTKSQQLYDFTDVRISQIQLSAYQIENIQAIPLMFQTGYLTLKDADDEEGIYVVGYPNNEVKQSYMEFLINAYKFDEVDNGRLLAIDIRKALQGFQLEKLKNYFNTLFKSIPYELWHKENEHFYHAIIHLTFRLVGLYVESKVQTSDGRLDALVKTDEFIYCFEFKLDESAEMALQQIKDKGYLTPYLHEGKRCFAIGVNFSKKDKKVEAILWEEVQ